MKIAAKKPTPSIDSRSILDIMLGSQLKKTQSTVSSKNANPLPSSMPLSQRLSSASNPLKGPPARPPANPLAPPPPPKFPPKPPSQWDNYNVPNIADIHLAVKHYNERIKAAPPPPKYKGKLCIVCATGIKPSHLDLNLLNYFINDVGRIKAKRQTKACMRHQRIMSTLIKRARQEKIIRNTFRAITGKGRLTHGASIIEPPSPTLGASVASK